MTENDAEQLTRKISGLEETLKQVSYQNEMMLRWVNGAVIKVDREGRAISANEEALRSLGWSEEEFLGRPVHATIHHSQDDGSEYPWDFCPVFAALEDGSSHHVDGDVFWKKDGSSFSADYIVCPTRDSDNEITGAILTFRNITEQRRQEGKRIHDMKLMAIGELSAGIAHEINTPVQFIGSNISFLAESFEDLLTIIDKAMELANTLKQQEEHQELIKEFEELCEDADTEYLAEEVPRALEQTQDGVDRVTKLVLGLKRFAHSGEGTEMTSVDVNDIIRNALIVSKNAYKYVATIEEDLQDLPTIKGNPGDLGQVIVNLVVNAAHAIEEKKGDSDAMGTITITTRSHGDKVVIQVTDTGSGIPEKVRSRIFDPFFTTKEVGKGSGQGLAISHTIVCEKHGGDISVDSTEGVGTCFTITLPVS